MNALQIAPPNRVLPVGFHDWNTLSVAPSALLSNGLTGIRRFCITDVPALYEAARESINELCTWMVWCRPNYSLGDSAAFVSSCDSNWETGESYSFVIFDAVDGTFLGSAGLNQINRAHNVANLGYWCEPTTPDTGLLRSPFAWSRVMASASSASTGLTSLCRWPTAPASGWRKRQAPAVREFSGTGS